MPNNFFLQDKNKPQSVDRLMTQLQVKLDQRHANFNANDLIIHLNQFKQHKSYQEKELIEQYQQLAGAVKNYFLQPNEKVNYESYRQFMDKLGELLHQMTQEEKKK